MCLIGIERSGVRIPKRASNVSFLQRLQSGCEVHPASYGYRGPFLWVKRPGREVEYSYSSSAEDNEWRNGALPFLPYASLWPGQCQLHVSYYEAFTSKAVGPGLLTVSWHRLWQDGMAIPCFKCRDEDRTECHSNNLLYHTKITKIIIIFRRRGPYVCRRVGELRHGILRINPYPTAFPYGNCMVLHFYQQQESSTTKTVHKVINKGLKAYV